MPNQTPDAAIAATRFGLGGRPGEIDRAGRDPIGYLGAQIRAGGADVPANGQGIAERLTTHYEWADRKRDLKEKRRATYVAGDGADPNAKKGKARFDAQGNRLIRPKRDAGLRDLHMQVVGDVEARLRLAVATDAAFRERWTLFWANHFTVGSKKTAFALLYAPYESEAIRPHVFGRFADMAHAVAHHPTMLIYLQQAKSVGPNSPVGKRSGKGLNENLARETLELHTLGVGSGYTQGDVTEFARALTGFAFGSPKDPAAQLGRFVFDPDAHEAGVRTIMGRRYPQAGEAQANAILRDVVADSRTAKHLSRKLAAHFVADDPPPELVNALSRAWIASDGDLAVVARTLVQSPAAWTPAPAKFKTPHEFLVSCYRAHGMSADDLVAAPKTLDGFGQRPFAAPSPKGWPDEAGPWVTSDAILDRLRFASIYAAANAGKSDPLATARVALGARLSPASEQAIRRAESREEALTILFMCPEFQRR